MYCILPSLYTHTSTDSGSLENNRIKERLSCRLYSTILHNHCSIQAMCSFAIQANRAV